MSDVEEAFDKLQFIQKLLDKRLITEEEAKEHTQKIHDSFVPAI